MITFTQLHYFLEVAKQKSFTKSANSLYITQQTLSNHISSIEQTLGTKLFQRTTPLKLTYAGQRFEEYAKRLVRTEQEMLKEFQDISNERKGQIYFGISYNRGALLLPQILTQFKKDYPDINIQVIEDNSLELQNMLVNGSIDLMLEQLPFANNIAYYELSTDYLYLLVTDDYLKECFGPEFIRIKSFLLNTGKIHVLKHCNFLLNKPGNSIRNVMDTIFQTEKFAANVVVESNNLETLYNLCINHYGCTIYPGNFLFSSYIKKPANLNIIQLDYPNTNYTLGIGYMNEHYLSKAARELIQLIQGYFV